MAQQIQKYFNDEPYIFALFINLSPYYIPWRLALQFKIGGKIGTSSKPREKRRSYVGNNDFPEFLKVF